MIAMNILINGRSVDVEYKLKDGRHDFYVEDSRLAGAGIQWDTKHNMFVNGMDFVYNGNEIEDGGDNEGDVYCWNFSRREDGAYWNLTIFND
jgi:hypothetical protein